MTEYPVHDKPQPTPEERSMRTRTPPLSPHTCSTCAYYHDLSGGEGAPVDLASGRRLGVYQSLCRRFPEHVRREPGDWCGEHPEVHRAVQEGVWVPLRPGWQELVAVEAPEEPDSSESGTAPG